LQTREDLCRQGRIWADRGGSLQTREDLGRKGRIFADKGGFGQIREDLGRQGRIIQDDDRSLQISSEDGSWHLSADLAIVDCYLSTGMQVFPLECGSFHWIAALSTGVWIFPMYVVQIFPMECRSFQWSADLSTGVLMFCYIRIHIHGPRPDPIQDES
jgi:hypothetical protein